MSVADLPVEVLGEIIKACPPGKEIFQQLSRVSRRFNSAVKLISYCVSCTVTLVPNNNDAEKQVVWLNTLTKKTFKTVRVPKFGQVKINGSSTSNIHEAERGSCERLLISIAECQAMVPLRSIVKHDPSRMISVLREVVDMSCMFPDCKPTKTEVYFEKFNTLGFTLDESVEARRVGEFAALLGALSLECHWKPDLVRNFKQSCLDLVVHGNVNNLHQLSNITSCLQQLEFKSTANLRSLFGAETLTSLRVLKFAKMEGMDVGESLARCDISRLTKLSKLVIDQGVTTNDFLTIMARVPSLTSFEKACLNDPHEVIQRQQQVGKTHAHLHQLQSLRVKLPHMDAVTYAISQCFPNLSLLGIDFDYLVNGNAAIDLSKDHLRQILKRFDSFRGLKKLVFIMNGPDIRTSFESRYQTPPAVFSEVTNLQVMLTFNEF
ncbi:hypothetical protein HDU76_000278 [Blyttiomyces sp. JEL0837]|nr:hypothetical protein HDU76_000278 [Blyttiomyces sp. JEL0837]